MPKYLIERDIPGASNLSPQERQQMAQKSLCALEHMEPSYRWLHSYVAGDKIFCVHEGPSEDSVREHSRRGGFPITQIYRIDSVIDPSTAASPKSAKRAETGSPMVATASQKP